MIDVIETHREELMGLCRKYHVARLEVFGSAVTGRFEPQRSDLDFLVEFLPESPMGPFRQYIDFLLELQSLFGRDVDLVEARAMKNPYFIRSANASRRVLYAA